MLFWIHFHVSFGDDIGMYVRCEFFFSFFIITVIIIIILSFQGVFDFPIVFPWRIFFFQPLCSKWLWHSSENVANIYNTLYIIPTYNINIKCYTILPKNIHFRAFFCHCCILFAFVTKHFDNNDNFLLRKISLLYCVIHCFHRMFRIPFMMMIQVYRIYLFSSYWLHHSVMFYV